jgi:hypothetical protein
MRIYDPKMNLEYGTMHMMREIKEVWIALKEINKTCWCRKLRSCRVGRNL